ncbi:MAG: hypothetical protein KDD25_09115, partial [Bdellovibrionales bacterium]|nr:hypothetical protein [Bdellovibrionales bacterium]
MRILVIGSGGREHAIVKALTQSDFQHRVFCSPGSDAIAKDAECMRLELANKVELAHSIKELKLDLVVVGPEEPLVNG